MSTAPSPHRLSSSSGSSARGSEDSSHSEASRGLGYLSSLLGLSPPRSPQTGDYYASGSSQLDLCPAARRHLQLSSASASPSSLRSRSSSSSPWPALGTRQLTFDDDDEVLVMDGVLLPGKGSSGPNPPNPPYPSPGGEGAASGGSSAVLGADLLEIESSDSQATPVCGPPWKGLAAALWCALLAKVGDLSLDPSGICITHFANQGGGPGQPPGPWGGEENRHYQEYLRRFHPAEYLNQIRARAASMNPAGPAMRPIRPPAAGPTVPRVRITAPSSTTVSSSSVAAGHSSSAPAVTGAPTAAAAGSSSSTPPVTEAPDAAANYASIRAAFLATASSSSATPTSASQATASAAVVSSAPSAGASTASSSATSMPISTSVVVPDTAIDRRHKIWAHWAMPVPRAPERNVYSLTRPAAVPIKPAGIASSVRITAPSPAATSSASIAGSSSSGTPEGTPNPAAAGSARAAIFAAASPSSLAGISSSAPAVTGAPNATAASAPATAGAASSVRITAPSSSAASSSSVAASSSSGATAGTSNPSVAGSAGAALLAAASSSLAGGSSSALEVTAPTKAAAAFASAAFLAAVSSSSVATASTPAPHATASAAVANSASAVSSAGASNASSSATSLPVSAYGIPHAATDRSGKIWAHREIPVPWAPERFVYPLTPEQNTFADRVMYEESPRPRLPVFRSITETEEVREASPPAPQQPGLHVPPAPAPPQQPRASVTITRPQPPGLPAQGQPQVAPVWVPGPAPQRHVGPLAAHAPSTSAPVLITAPPPPAGHLLSTSVPVRITAPPPPAGEGASSSASFGSNLKASAPVFVPKSKRK